MPLRDDIPKLPLPWGKLADGSPGYRKAAVEHHGKKVLSFANGAWYKVGQALISELVTAKTPKEKRQRAEQMIQDTYESLEPERPYEIDLHLGPWW
jgi:hypothetical protein